MKIEILTKEKYSAYESFLSKHKASMIYYSIKFKCFLEKLTKSEARYFIALDEEEIIQGILPLIIKDGSFGKVINSLPYYGSNGGILAKTQEASEVLIKKYIEILNSGEYSAATLIENPLDKSYSYNKIPSDQTDYRIGQLTNIRGSFQDLEHLMIIFDSKTRNVIRKAIKSDVKVTIENNLFGFLQKTHVENIESIGGLAKDDSFFHNVKEYFEAGVDYNIYVARLNDTPIAAVLVFYYGKVVEYYTPVIVKEFRSYQPLSLIIATAMFEANKVGFECWNWGGTWQSQDGVYDFKSKWGTIDINYTYHISIYNNDFYKCSKAELLKEYSGFYVLPFSLLKK